jgi:hypothetical protein
VGAPGFTRLERHPAEANDLRIARGQGSLQLSNLLVECIARSLRRPTALARSLAGYELRFEQPGVVRPETHAIPVDELAWPVAQQLAVHERAIRRLQILNHPCAVVNRQTAMANRDPIIGDLKLAFCSAPDRQCDPGQLELLLARIASKHQGRPHPGTLNHTASSFATTSTAASPVATPDIWAWTRS